MHSVTVVIPTYNEVANLGAVVRNIRSVVTDARIIVVDDNSPDGTGALADRLARDLTHMEVIHRAAKNGIGPAYIAGFQKALVGTGDLIVTMDADGSHAPADLARMLEAIADADLVIGSRYVNGGRTVGWPRHRQWLSRLGGIYARVILGVPVHDLTAGFKVYRRETVSALALDGLRSDGYGFQIETTWRTWRAGYRVREVPITFHDRIAGKSKLSRRIVAEAIVLVWRLRFERVRHAHP
jgi:dolichol-phosphate mannosyltransferase